MSVESELDHRLRLHTYECTNILGQNQEQSGTEVPIGRGGDTESRPPDARVSRAPRARDRPEPYARLRAMGGRVGSVSECGYRVRPRVRSKGDYRAPNRAACRFSLAFYSGGLTSGFGPVQGRGGTKECLQRLLVYLLALVEVDGAPYVPVKTGVEEAGGILQSRTFGEGQLHDALVGLARADHSVVVPHRNPSPLPFLDDVRNGSLDKAAERAEHLAPPVAELLDSAVDELSRRLTLLRPALLHARFSPLVPRVQCMGAIPTSSIV